MLYVHVSYVYRLELPPQNQSKSGCSNTNTITEMADKQNTNKTQYRDKQSYEKQTNRMLTRHRHHPRHRRHDCLPCRSHLHQSSLRLRHRLHRFRYRQLDPRIAVSER